MRPIVLFQLFSTLPKFFNVSNGYAEAHANEHDGRHHPGLSEQLGDAGAIWSI